MVTLSPWFQRNAGFSRFRGKMRFWTFSSIFEAFGVFDATQLPKVLHQTTKSRRKIGKNQAITDRLKVLNLQLSRLGDYHSLCCKLGFLLQNL